MTPVVSLPHTVFIRPFLGSGHTPSGLYVEYHESYPPMLGRVTAAHPSIEVCQVGDVVMFHPYSYAEEDYHDGTLRVLHDKNITAILEGYPDAE